jgi:hypothetical protein
MVGMALPDLTIEELIALLLFYGKLRVQKDRRKEAD